MILGNRSSFPRNENWIKIKGSLQNEYLYSQRVLKLYHELKIKMLNKQVKMFTKNLLYEKKLNICYNSVEVKKYE